MTRPITESQNPLTLNIDAVNPEGMVRIFRQSDAQIFSGYECHPALTDQEIIEKLAAAAIWMAELFSPSETNGIFLSGAGTSGRFAHLLSLEYNRVLKENGYLPIFRPLIAGGDAALIRAQESAEDSAEMAANDLKLALPDGLKNGLYIGITAGVSAPYVAAQLDHLSEKENFNSILLGFNPLETARDRPVEGWEKTVKQVIDGLMESDRFMLLNPIYGPEPVTGSTRMKGGSVTRIVMDIVFAVALEIARSDKLKEKETLLPDREDHRPLYPRIRQHIASFAASVHAAYSNIPDLSALVRSAGVALRSGGRIIYLGRGISGYLGIIDASECPPTFGAGYFDVRGYLRDGWEFLGANSAAMKARGREHAVDHDFFETEILPELAKGDLVIAIAASAFGDNTRRLIAEANKKRANTAALLVRNDSARDASMPENVRYACTIDVPKPGFIPGANNELELALKLALNAITTGAHIMAGKVYTNVMIDLRISNSKLYDRAIGLVQKLAGVTQEEARAALHHAIFEEPQTTEQIEASAVVECIARASDRGRIVPMAILLATGKFNYEDAKEQLHSEPRVRQIIESALKESQ